MNTPLIDTSVWDKWRKFEVTENSPGFFLGLLETGLSSTTPQMQSLMAAIERQDLKEIIYFSHTLSSTCRSLGAPQLASHLKDIEWSARATPPVVKRELSTVIQKMFENFAEELKKEIARIKGS